VKKSSIYIHIPFCDVKCNYCDFYVQIKHSRKSQLLDSLKREIEYFAELYKDKSIFHTIYFGGGTPSLVEPKYIAKIITTLRSNFIFDEYVEITLETNPETVDGYKLDEFRSIGINRLSIGVQSFNDEDLDFLTRNHNGKQAIECVELAAKSGFRNINVDLIFSLPSQSLESWKQNLSMTIDLPIQHISAYSLILEPGTSLFYQVKNGLTALRSIEHDADSYELLIDFLTDNNFFQYEVSNFTKPGFECIHNLNYWYHVNYLGFGPSAHSLWDDKRWNNFSNITRYLNSVKMNCNGIKREEFLNPTELYNERIYLGLRSRGLDLTLFEKDFNISLLSSEEKFINELLKSDFVVIDNNFLILTKKGYLLCDEICEQLMI
jgi:oxygen-independent coproporphyrinogen-3 oxidase